MMENSNDDDAKLKAEIEAELDKISISSLENDDDGSDSESETQSKSSDTDLDELPESVLHCINIIKNKSKTAEELILQDLEDTDVSSFSYGAVSNNHMHLRIQLSTEFQENPEQLMKQEQDKMNDELHKEEKKWEEKCKQHEELIKNLQLQMEEERIRLKDLQEKEKMRLLKLQHNSAIKIQANYKAFVAYRKYNPVIKEQVENKKKKAQEWKEKEAKLRHWEEEKQKRLEEEQRIEEEKKKQKQEELKKRQKEYEEKKKILRLEREQVLFKEKVRIREDASKQLTSKTLEKGEYDSKHLSVEDTSKKKSDIAKKLVDEKSKNQEETPLWLVIDKKLDVRENESRPLALKELVQETLKEHISNQENLAELNEEEKKENLAKQKYSEKLINIKRKYENIDKQLKSESPDLIENMKEKFKLQELKSQIKSEGKLKYAMDETIEQETEIIILGHNDIFYQAKNNETQKIIKDNQQTKVQEVEKERIPEQNGTLCEENKTSVISAKRKLGQLELETSENIGKDVVLQEVIDLKSNEIKNSKDNALNSDAVIINTSNTIINIENNINKQDSVLGSQTLCENSRDYNAESSLVSVETNSVNSEIKDISEGCHETRPEHDGIMACFKPEPTILSAIEEKRLSWKKSFKPWLEIFKKHQQKKIVKKKRFVKCPANTMPPLNTLEILQFGPWNTLKQVTTVTFQDLPGCNLSTLAECTNLQFLSLRRCGLTSLHNLSNCKNIKYIDVQENLIQTINCENLENLSILLLNKNQLNSLHGLDGCINIQNLELSHNKITRIGLYTLKAVLPSPKPKYKHFYEESGLESLKNLQQLILDHNQLISTKGLCDTPTIIYLDCSYNHLTELEGIANCGLLQILKLQGNYLSELPSLENHVLLRDLQLDDNSISTVETFSSYWLPLLQNLTLSQNSLTEIIPLFHFVSLEKLDVSNNCLSDLTSAIRGVDACFSLRELSLTGNPLLQEINWRPSLLKMLPALRILNGEILKSYSESHTEGQYQEETGSFLAVCRSQIQELNTLIENYITGNGNVFSMDGAENLFHYFKKLMSLSNEYRYAHENMIINIMGKDKSEAKENHLVYTQTDNLLQNTVLNSCASEHKPDPSDISEKWINFGSNDSPLANSSMCINVEIRNQEQEQIINEKREDTQANKILTKRIPFTKNVMTTSLLKNCLDIQHNEKSTAALIIQSRWRGYIVRKQIHLSTRLHTAAKGPLTSQPNSHIKSQTVLKAEKTKHSMNTEEQKEKAATRIQAVWKGFLLRKKLTTALEAVKSEESEEYEEIDLEDFTFNEAALEKEWLSLDPTRFPSQTQLLPNQLYWPKYSRTLKYDDTSLNLPSHPTQAWLCNEKENVFSSEDTQFNNRSENRTLSWTPESKTHRKSLLQSEKAKKISEEWGFKDISTAQQMLKRAQKMKSKKLREKKDPAVRLALFKDSESKLSVTKAPKKTQPRSHHHFEASKEDGIHRDTTANEKIERSREYTYQWLHTQVGVHETTSSRNMKCNRFLPELDPDVLNGRRVQLVARLVSREDTDLDLFSMTSGSALSVNKEKKNQAHRHSAGSLSKLWFPSEFI
ncbi:PREDICTED: leucine-rich repeat and IQ domain-containing protein 1 [Chrysochloris asiatica]|uniref:Leucine-rich repeat and IQ domain-containing protein 1 n=1 Tax=Chrysochloris asiatica TaxID=185453 RepID=A0A9B0WZJ0_CHRAS|nr:PREDICTED: leucine-rich repeat and IQ domain-containing protein 1 [Chrysochloris asiatica]